MNGTLSNGRRLTLTAAVVLALGALALRAAPAQAETQVIDVIFHTAALPVTNLCNDQVVVLHGDLHVRQVRTTTPGGGEVVNSLITSEGLIGADVNGMPYTANDIEASFAHYAPPGRTSVFFDVHATLLVPQGNAPTMLLVIVVAEKVRPDGTTTVLLDRAWTACSQPGRARAA
jgi:hypothetical protein